MKHFELTDAEVEMIRARRRINQAGNYFYLNGELVDTCRCDNPMVGQNSEARQWYCLKCDKSIV